MLIELGVVLDGGVRPALDIVVEGMGRIVEVEHLEAEDHVGLGDQGARALAQVVFVPGRKVHAAAHVADRHVQGFGELDQAVDAGLGAGVAVGEDHRIFRVDQHLGGFRQRVLVAGDRRHARQLGNARLLLVLGQRLVLHLAVEDEEGRRHRRRHGDLVGAHRGIREMLERHRRVVPLDEVAHQSRRHPAPHAPRPRRCRAWAHRACCRP